MNPVYIGDDDNGFPIFRMADGSLQTAVYDPLDMVAGQPEPFELTNAQGLRQWLIPQIAHGSGDESSVSLGVPVYSPVTLDAAHTQYKDQPDGSILGLNQDTGQWEPLWGGGQIDAQSGSILNFQSLFQSQIPAAAVASGTYQSNGAVFHKRNWITEQKAANETDVFGEGLVMVGIAAVTFGAASGAFAAATAGGSSSLTGAALADSISAESGSGVLGDAIPGTFGSAGVTGAGVDAFDISGAPMSLADSISSSINIGTPAALTAPADISSAPLSLADEISTSVPGTVDTTGYSVASSTSLPSISNLQSIYKTASPIVNTIKTGAGIIAALTGAGGAMPGQTGVQLPQPQYAPGGFPVIWLIIGGAALLLLLRK